jgi:phenylalanyl-tRNA synthetase beta chain
MQCSHDENFAHLRQKDDGTTAVKLANPKTIEYQVIHCTSDLRPKYRYLTTFSDNLQVVRTSLLPGLLKTIACNKNLPLPLKVFEVSDVVFKEPSIERGARNQRNFAVAYANIKTSGFEVKAYILSSLL